MEDGEGLLSGKSGNRTSPRGVEQSHQASPVSPTVGRTAPGYVNDAAQSRRSRRENVVNEGARVGHANVLSWLQDNDTPSQQPDAEEAPSTVRMESVTPF